MPFGRRRKWISVTTSAGSRAVVKVSMKNSRAGTCRSEASLRQMTRALAARSAAGDVVKHRVAGDDRVLEDLTVGAAGPDLELVVGFDDGVEAADVLDVDDERWL